MPTKQVTIQGIMTWEEPGGPDNSLPRPPGQVSPPIYYPPGFWGPNDPRPDNSLPGQPPGIWGPTDPRPGYGLPGGPPPVVGGGPIYPPGIWGPNDPRPGYGLPGQPPQIWGPTDPRPGYGPPGNQPGVGYPGFPTPPIYIAGGGVATPPAAGVPVKGSLTFYEGKGYVFVPENSGESVPPEGGEVPPQ